MDVDSDERSEGQQPSSDDSSSEEEDDETEAPEEEQEADGAKSREGGGDWATARGLARKISEPLALFYDREENEWDSSIEVCCAHQAWSTRRRACSLGPFMRALWRLPVLFSCPDRRYARRQELPQTGSALRLRHPPPQVGAATLAGMCTC